MSVESIIEEMTYYLKNKKSQDLAQVAETVSVWDFNTALGGTMYEKYESLFVKIVETSAVLVRKGAKGYFWAMCSPEVASMFETSLKFRPTNDTPDYFPMGISEKQCVGIIDKRWRLYVDPMMDCNYIVVGCGNNTSPEHLARISIANFVI